MRHVGWLQEAWRRDFNEKSEFMTKTDPIVKEFYWESVGDESRKKKRQLRRRTKNNLIKPRNREKHF